MSVEPRLSRYLHQKAAAMGFPVAGNFELTPRCNFNCKMCYIHLSEAEQRRRGRELSAEQWLEIGEAAAREGLVFLLLTGGEPTLRPDFIEILRGLKRLGLLISVNTNGYLLQGELRERLMADPPHRLNITLYGTSNETYEALCGVPAYDRVVENIRALRQAGMDVKLNLTLAPDNLRDRETVAEKALELGAHLQTAAYLFPPLRVTGQSAFPQRLAPEEAGRVEALQRLRSMDRSQLQTLREKLTLPEEMEESCAYCRSGRSAFWLSWDGKMLPCGMLPYPAPNVLELGFSEAWRIVRDTVKTLRYPLACQQCRYREVCQICLAKCYTETQGFEKAPVYCCRMTRSMLEAMNIPCEMEVSS